MPFYTLYRVSDGRAISHGTVAPENIAAGRAVIELANPPADNTQWDEATLAFIPIPPKVFINRAVELLTHPDFVDIQEAYQALSAANRTKVRNGITRLLGDKLLRRDTETLAIKD